MRFCRSCVTVVVTWCSINPLHRPLDVTADDISSLQTGRSLRSITHWDC